MKQTTWGDYANTHATVRKRRIPDQRLEESKKEKIGGKQNNSRSIKPGQKIEDLWTR